MRNQRLFDKYYFLRPGFVDGTTEFHELLRKHVRPGSRILEIGAGPANRTSRFLASLGTVVGADVSEEVRGNTFLAEAHVFDGRSLPFSDASFDACISDYVLEHVEDPGAHFREAGRVLRTGGIYAFRTPNQWHYVTLASRLLPHRAHLMLANPLRGLGDEAHDPYPVFYRSNRLVAVRRLAAAAGLQVATLYTVEKEPSYGRIHAALFYPMMMYERLVNAVPGLRGLRANIVAVLEKPRLP